MQRTTKGFDMPLLRFKRHFSDMMKINALFILSLVAWTNGSALAGSAYLTDFPIHGTFGNFREKGCRSAKIQEEGDYVIFYPRGETGEGGDGGCDYKKIEKLSDSEYVLKGLCFNLEGPKRPVTATLIVTSPDEIIYGGQRYRRCKK